jgi:hypothetical protein
MAWLTDPQFLLVAGEKKWMPRMMSRHKAMQMPAEETV